MPVHVSHSPPLHPRPPREPPHHPCTVSRSHPVEKLWEQPGAVVNFHVASHASRQPSIFSSSITAGVFFHFSRLLLTVSRNFCPLSSFLYSKKSNQAPCPQMVAFLTAPAMDGSGCCWCPASLAAGAQLSFCSGLKIHPVRIKIWTNTAGCFRMFTENRCRWEYLLIMYQITGMMMLGWKTAAGVVPDS